MFFSTLPCLEGKKKMPIMILSWQPILGRGCRQSLKLPDELQERHMKLNLLGHPVARSMIYLFLFLFRSL